MDKKEIRKHIKVQRLALDENRKYADANIVFSKLEETKEFKNSQNILFYYSLPDELPTLEFLKKWSSTKNIYLPRVNGENLEILAYNDSKLSIGSFNIEEPIGNEIIEPHSIDLIIVPAVAFDFNKNRLGRGKGFYDRLLSQATNAIKIGVGYDFQIFETIPTEPHDIPMDIVISPNHVI